MVRRHHAIKPVEITMHRHVLEAGREKERADRRALVMADLDQHPAIGHEPAGGAGSDVPGLMRTCPPSVAKARSSAGMPRMSSIFAHASGIANCARIAIWRTTSAVTYSTVFCRAGSVFANAHGASPAK